MELTQLHYFMCVAECEHMTHAAEKLYISQPALTKTIHLLEKELGVKLFKKKGRNITLTECGKYLQQQLKAPLKMMETLPAVLKKIEHNETHTIRINLLTASMIVSNIVIDYKKYNPDVFFSIIQSESIADADITIETYASKGEVCINTENEVSFDEEIKLAVPKNDSLSQKSAVNLDDCIDKGLICIGGSKRFRNICDEICRQAKVFPKIIFESDNQYAVKNLIIAGTGYGFWPEFSWGKVDGDFVLLKINGNNVKRRIVARLNRDSMDDSVKVEFFKFLCDSLKNIMQ